MYKFNVPDSVEDRHQITIKLKLKTREGEFINTKYVFKLKKNNRLNKIASEASPGFLGEEDWSFIIERAMDTS
uniref:Uncharacterized protein n=1 Tax=Romanomermis culicivorax TaxID=13658 RepID=A0A915JQH5_ROMCU